MTLGILGRTDQKQQALRQIAASGGDYADEASYELGRSYIAQEKYAEGAAQLEKFVAAYPSSPRCTQAMPRSIDGCAAAMICADSSAPGT